MTYGHVVGVRLRTDLADQRNRGGLDELVDAVLVKIVAEDGLALVELLEQDDARLLDALCLGQGGIVGGAEEELVAEGVGDPGEGLVGRLVVSVEVAHDDDVLGLLELLDRVLVQDRNCGQRLLDHVGHDSGSRKSMIQYDRAEVQLTLALFVVRCMVLGRLGRGRS